MFGVCAATMSFTTLDAGPNAVPEVCTTIEEVGSTGVGALTITFIILVICGIVFLYKAVNSAAQKKYYLAACIIAVWASLADFAMLSGQGWTVTDGCRQFFYARYVDWIVTGPVTAIWLGLIAGAETTDIVGAVAGNVMWVASTYMASISVAQEVKWCWFILSLCGLAAYVLSLVRTFKVAAEARSEGVSQLYTKMVWLTVGCSVCYPLIWLFSEGFGNFSVSFEVTTYSILDILARAVVSFMLFSGHDALGDGEAVSQREFV